MGQRDPEDDKADIFNQVQNPHEMKTGQLDIMPEPHEMVEEEKVV